MALIFSHISYLIEILPLSTSLQTIHLAYSLKLKPSLFYFILLEELIFSINSWWKKEKKAGRRGKTSQIALTFLSVSGDKEVQERKQTATGENPQYFWLGATIKRVCFMCIIYLGRQQLKYTERFSWSFFLLQNHPINGKLKNPSPCPVSAWEMGAGIFY